MTDAELTKIRELLVGLTETFPLPWRVVGDSWADEDDEGSEEWEILTPSFHPQVRTIVATTTQSEEMAEFIANAPRWLDELLAMAVVSP